jgi:spore coat protein CotH
MRAICLRRLSSLIAIVAIQTFSPVSLARAQSDADAALFDDTVVHDIRLTMSSRDWESLKEHFQESTRYPADLRWRDQTVRNIAIRSRGNGSRSGSKPGLKFDINYYAADRRFLGLKNLVLRNNTQDASNMREFLSMKFFRRMNLAAPRESFTRLYLNDVYMGLYTIVEDIDKDFLAKNLGEDNGWLYEYDFDETNRVPYAFEYLGSDPAKYVPLPFKAQTHETDPRGDVIERFVWTINEAGAAAWRQQMEEYLDLKKFMRHLGIENFLAEEDGITGDYGPNNFYVYRRENRNLFMFLPWDKSNTFWETPGYWIFRNIRDGAPDHRNRLVLRALTYDDLEDEYLNALNESADAAAESGWLEARVGEVYDLIRAAATADPTKPYTNDQFEAAVAGLRVFARERSAAVRSQVADERKQ